MTSLLLTTNLHTPLMMIMMMMSTIITLLSPRSYIPLWIILCPTFWTIPGATMMNNGKKEEIIINTQDQDKKQNIDNILNDYPLDEDYISSTNIFCLKTKHGPFMNDTFLKNLWTVFNT